MNCTFKRESAFKTHIISDTRECNLHFHNVKPQVPFIWLLKHYRGVPVWCNVVAAKRRHTVTSPNAKKIMRRLFNQAT